MDQYQAEAYLVNTGWTGGSYGIGHRMSLKATRAIIDAILNGSINNSEFDKTQFFGVQIPTSIEGVDSTMLNPKNAWKDKDLFEQTAKKLARQFNENFKTFSTTELGKSLIGIGPKE